MLGPGIVKRQNVDALAGLIEAVEPLAEADEVLPFRGGSGDRGLKGRQPGPVDDLVAEHPVVNELQPGTDLGTADRLLERQAVRYRGRRDDLSERLGSVLRQHGGGRQHDRVR